LSAKRPTAWLPALTTDIWIFASSWTLRVWAADSALPHNLLGRVYLAIILPFHRLIVRSMLRQVAA
jgi:hypothetical protein